MPILSVEGIKTSNKYKKRELTVLLQKLQGLFWMKLKAKGLQRQKKLESRVGLNVY